VFDTRNTKMAVSVSSRPHAVSVSSRPHAVSVLSRPHAVSLPIRPHALSASSRPHSPPYSIQETPRAKSNLVGGPPNTLPKAWSLFRVGSYLIGSLLFLSGSILFYPSYALLWNGNGPYVASYCFVIGCILFVIGTNADFIDTIRDAQCFTFWMRVFRIYNRVSYVIAGVIFLLGSVYFIPEYYALYPTLGCWAFIYGSVLFCISGFVDLLFLAYTPNEHEEISFTPRKLASWDALAAIATLIGAFLFVLGSYYYLPKFIATEDIVASTAYAVLACIYFIIGSVFFLINALCQTHRMLRELRSQPSIVKDELDLI
jgi:hypothetical protein